MNYKSISLAFLQKCLMTITSMWIYFGLVMIIVAGMLRLLMHWKLV